MKWFGPISVYLTLVGLFLSLGLKGQEEGDSASVDEKSLANTHEVGAALGLTTGYGVSYRFWPSRFGLQGAVYHVSRKEDGFPKVNRSLGLTFLYELVDGEVTDLLLYQGNHLLYRRLPVIPQNCSTYPCGRKIEARRNLYNGLGFGVRFMILDVIDFSLMTGYALHTNELFKGHSTYELSLTGEAGLFYRF